jgi:large subunit ribosomal protein L15
MRGSHTHGWGSKKKHRGGGSQAGKGRAGTYGAKRSWVTTNKPDYFGRHGFKRPEEVTKIDKIINLEQIEEIAMRTGKKEVDVGALGYTKVLSGGKLTKPITIKAPVINERAKAKITEAGGSAIETAPKKQEGK